MNTLQNNEKIPDIFRTEAFKEFIRDHVHNDARALLLKMANGRNAHLRLFAAQLSIYRKAIHKLPTFVNNFCVFSPKSYEQSSSETAAFYKASRYAGNKCLDICGGLGVDDWAFSKHFKQVVSLDMDPGLNELVRFNFETLNILNVLRLDADATRFLQTCGETFDLVYADADRRVSGKKLAGFEGAEPFVPALLPNMFALSERVLLKASPMADITACLKQLHGVKEVEVVAVQHEVKELLFHLQRGYSDVPVFTATAIDRAGKLQQFSATQKQPGRTIGAEGVHYFYEPAPALIKSGLTETYAAQMPGMHFAGRQSLYLLSHVLHEDFFGRAFSIVQQMPYNIKNIIKYLGLRQITYGNIAKRDFPDNTDIIRKKLKLKDGGVDYFFFTRGGNDGKPVCYHCRKI